MNTLVTTQNTLTMIFHHVITLATAFEYPSNHPEHPNNDIAGYHPTNHR